MVISRRRDLSKTSKGINSWSALFLVFVMKVKSSDSSELALCHFTDLSFFILSSKNIKPVTNGDRAAQINFSSVDEWHNYIALTFAIDKKRRFMFVFCIQHKYSGYRGSWNSISVVTKTTRAAKVATYSQCEFHTVGILITKSFLALVDIDTNRRVVDFIPLSTFPKVASGQYAFFKVR